MKYPYILFDFDGTLSESGPGIIKAMKYGLTAVNIHEDNENTLRSVSYTHLTLPTNREV